MSWDIGYAFAVDGYIHVYGCGKNKEQLKKIKIRRLEVRSKIDERLKGGILQLLGAR